VAPPRKQADNRENKHFPIALGGSCLLEKGKKMEDGRIGSWEGERAWNSELGMRNGEEGKDKATDSHRCTWMGGKKMEDGRIGSWEDEKVKEGIEDGKSGG